MSDRIVPFKKFDDDKQVVFAEVYAPGVIDSQGDFMTQEEIEKMAWRFMSQGRVSKVDTQHDLIDNGSLVVESFTAREGDPDFIKGAWVVGMKLPDKEWRLAKDGQLNGFSMYGQGIRKERMVEMEIPDDGMLKGHTSEAEGHEHEYVVTFDKSGNFLGGRTVPDKSGHIHNIEKGPATERILEHSHRFSFMEYLI